MLVLEQLIALKNPTFNKFMSEVLPSWHRRQNVESFGFGGVTEGSLTRQKDTGVAWGCHGERRS